MSTITDSAASSLYASLFPSNTTTQNATSQALSDLTTALQSGNVAGAQSALANLQKALGQSTSSSPASATKTSPSPFGGDSQANTDYKDLVGAINAGDLTNAQSALSNLQSDLKAHHGGHHGHGAPPPTQVSTTDTTPTSDSTSSSSGNYVNVTV